MGEGRKTCLNLLKENGVYKTKPVEINYILMYNKYVWKNFTLKNYRNNFTLRVKYINKNNYNGQTYNRTERIYKQMVHFKLNVLQCYNTWMILCMKDVKPNYPIDM